MTNSIQKFDDLVESSDFVFAVFFRGHWCPFCIAYLKDLQQILPQITEKGGKVVIITAEPADKLPETLARTKFTGDTIIDEDTSLAAELKKRDLVNIAITEKKGYPYGMIQPAVLVMRKNVPLYSWAIVPAMMNLGGAKDRVVLSEVWEDVQAMLKDPSFKPRRDYSKTAMSVGLKQHFFG